jgi:carbon-monoxide dehydrogenase medium subunit
MIDFDFQAPTSLEEACAVLQQRGDEARVIAGGTALVILMKQRLVRPELVVSLRRIPELQRLAAENGTLRVGATVTHRALETDANVRQRWT